jgi:hypothetical protein
MGDKTLTVRRATASGQPKPDRENVLAQAQQHIALQKLAMQVGSGIPGLFTAARGCEYIFDYAFERIGVEGGQVEHPILMTECPYNPLQSRSKMAELLFETYGVPYLAFGVDAAFSYKYNWEIVIVMV